MRNRIAKILAATGVLMLVAPTAGTAGGDSAYVVEGLPVGDPSESLTASPDESALTSPPVTGEMVSLNEEIESQYGNDPRYSAVEFTRDRSRTIIWWHGDVPDELQRIIASSTVPVELRQTDYLPGDLRDAVQKILDSDEAAVAGVIGGGPAADGSGIELTLAPANDAWSVRSMESGLRRVTRYPISITRENIVSLSNRQFDTP